jgi:hypothetical protein
MVTSVIVLFETVISSWTAPYLVYTVFPVNLPLTDGAWLAVDAEDLPGLLLEPFPDVLFPDVPFPGALFPELALPVDLPGEPAGGPPAAVLLVGVPADKLPTSEEAMLSVPAVEVW